MINCSIVTEKWYELLSNVELKRTTPGTENTEVRETEIDTLIKQASNSIIFKVHQIKIIRDIKLFNFTQVACQKIIDRRNW